MSAASEKGRSGDLLVWADWSSLARFTEGGREEHASEWAAFKEAVAARLTEFFAAKFPALAPLVVYQELGTPFATASFTGHEKGAIYGVETTPRRVLSEALHAATPVPGLYLSGQDVVTPGIAGALWGGMFGAAAVDSRLFKRFR